MVTIFIVKSLFVHSDVIGQDLTGIIVSNCDLKVFERAVLRLIQGSRLRREMGAKAQTHCAELFDMKKIAGVYEQLFFNLIEARDRRSNGQAA